MTKFDPLHPVPCVYYKHGAYWLVKRGKWESIGKTLDEALAEYGRRAVSVKDGRLQALIEATLQHHFKVATLAASTKLQYRMSADILKRRFRAFDEPGQVKARHVAQLKVDGAEHPNMTNRTTSLLRTLFGYWLEQGKCESNPCVGVRRYQEAKRKRLITMEEWSAIYEQAGPRLRAIMKIAFLTGQRISDVLKIHRRQITADGLFFHQQKTDKLLTVKWSQELRAAVSEALALHGRAQAMWLFVGRMGKHADYRTVLLQWHLACEAAGVADAKPNDQRAQSLTNTKRQGKSATKLAGHTTEAMTNRYLRDRESELVDGPSLDAALNANSNAKR